MKFVFAAAALPSGVSWDEIGRVLVPLVAIVSAVYAVLKLKDWFDKHYVTRLEFEQLVVDSSRNQKIIDRLVEIGAKRTRHE